MSKKMTYSPDIASLHPGFLFAAYENSKPRWVLGRSCLPCCSMYRLIIFSLIPMVEEKYPTLQIHSLSKYISLMNLNCFLRRRLDIIFIFWTHSAITISGGMIICMWMWSSSQATVRTSTVGYFSSNSLKQANKTSNTYDFRYLRRYLVPHTTWYSCWYVEWLRLWIFIDVRKMSILPVEYTHFSQRHNSSPDAIRSITFCVYICRSLHPGFPWSTKIIPEFSGITMDYYFTTIFSSLFGM